MKSIKQVLIERDCLPDTQADDLIDAAKVALDQYIDAEDHVAVENICVEFFDIHDLEYVFDLWD